LSEHEMITSPISFSLSSRFEDHYSLRKVVSFNLFNNSVGKSVCILNNTFLAATNKHGDHLVCKTTDDN